MNALWGAAALFLGVFGQLTQAKRAWPRRAVLPSRWALVVPHFLTLRCDYGDGQTFIAPSHETNDTGLRTSQHSQKVSSTAS
eukprot:2742205-Amphidinium_carterae.1